MAKQRSWKDNPTKTSLKSKMSSNQRLELIYSIYEADYQGKLKTESTKSIEIKPRNDFYTYLLHDKKELLAEKLKEQFGNEKGKTLALMLKVLEENEPRLIHIGNTQIGFFNSLKAYFPGDNGSQNGMFSSFSYNQSRGYQDYLSVKAKIDFILKQLDET